ncbi:MAG TPA: L-glyceraldehyde 3-phosphate reductase, partial [Clostridiales bacterium]|nr:L-glyceraldehyde 3-phosphate reductase [Clostridiales bacterium]
AGSRIAKGATWIANELNDEMISKLNRLNDIAKQRGQKLSQMALSWILRDGKITTILCGASSPKQIEENVEAIYKTKFTDEKLKLIEEVIV